MSEQPVITFKNVSKSFVLNRENQLKHRFGSKKAASKQEIAALKNISFNIKPKETVGFYGANGSGKTTILRLIAGIHEPDTGIIKVKGKVAPIIELGSGLHPELSGTDNIYLYGAILGVSRKELDRNFKKILSFSGLNKFINVPLKKYSTGMRARLAFSVALFSNPDILLIDEVLSVGDVDFKEKSLKMIKRLKNKKTIVYVSHDFSLIQQFCDKMFYIKNGSIIKSSNSRIKQFLGSFSKKRKFVVEASTNSMWPVISKGDKLTIQKTSFQDLRTGDIIAFTFENISEIVVHRIAESIREKEGKKYLTKGDANFQKDPWILKEKNYLGKVVKVMS